MKLIAFLILQVISVQLVRCQGNGGGGPSTFGYDASSACSKPYSRAGRTRLVNLPCDFRRQSWCTVAGSSYPWHAVRRFVQENQGLMRRMYGDEKHINILKAEFEKNDIELKYDDYYHPFSDDSRGYQYEDEFDSMEDEERILRSDDEEYGGRGFTSRSFNDPTTKRFGKFPKLNEYTRLRATESSTTSTTTIAASSATSTTTSSTTIESSKASSTTTVASTMVASTTVSSASVDFTTKEIDSIQSSSSTTPKKVENEVEEKNETFTHTQMVREQNLSINEISEQIDRIDEKVDEKVEDKLEEPTEQTEVPELNIEDDSNVDSLDAPTSSTVFTEDSFDVGKETTIHETFVNDDQQQFRPRPEYRPSTRPATVNMEGQLYQDVAGKDQQQEQPVLKLRGVNACPVKEEVVAPFWANNTRGEVLALLNLYPFEQYVHWEKCTHENKQMYCRDGCRCEQQYRLHRLLAYDPNNECRGIFSDWFKFPSCCVCRCYDLPLEFRVTSRSPRTQKQRLRVLPPRSKFF
ncbi:PREDICTED: RNA polymerase II degradation factor 1 [Polistes dominula]|uniref:RNA polymerase II degradation factor 1 n=1 Tax=Polistes dominula TaxID=743375 RepID=A0ABM1HXZ4_POLDO|nr:PREDICTED: RNA polymerase II degradation factor 1 [Polistes dominula]